MSNSTSTARATYPVAPQFLPDRQLEEGRYLLRFAQDDDDLDAVLRLRYEVFNLELQEGLDSSHESGRDLDRFDPVCHHLMVIERSSGDVVGCYRMQTSEMARQNLGFYSQTEFDLGGFPPGVIDGSMEIGRACVAREHRSTHVLFLLWKGLALYVAANRRRFLFGCSSLTSQDPVEGKAFMDQMVAKDHLHPQFTIRPQPGFECYPEGFTGNPECRVRTPPLFRIYLRHGAKVCGPPAIDREFRTIDFLILFDVDRMDRKMFATFFD
jgi:putative hemolysin